MEMIGMAAVRTQMWFLVLAIVTWHGPVASQERVDHALGDFEYVASPIGVLIAAPHGTFDAYTDTLAIAAARQAGAGYVVARKFSLGKNRINVNRPTEGAFVGCSQEPQTARAQDVYGTYLRLVANAASGKPLRLYVEIHGNSNQRTAQSIEVATVGISAAQAQKVKDGYSAMLARARERVSAYPELALIIEPVDRVYYTASCAKKIGIFATEAVPRGVHFEFPRVAREGDALQVSASLVSDIVRQILNDQ
jgi:hypothetical protein